MGLLLCLPLNTIHEQQDARFQGTSASDDPNSQNFDTKVVKNLPDTDETAAPTLSNNLFAEPDVTSYSLQLGAANIGHLLQHGSLPLDVHGQQLELTLVSYLEQDGVEHIRLSSFDGRRSLPGTITRKGSAFFATLATTTEVWRIQGQGTHAQAVAHTQISSSRTLYEKDFIHAPHVHAPVNAP